MRPLHDLLDDLTVSYITTKFQPELITVLNDSFNILERFDLPEYESPYIDLISRSEDVEGDVTRDRFISTLRSQLVRVIDDHSLTLDEDSDPTLTELNELLFFLLLLQDLEDTSQLSYRLNGAGTDRVKFVDLLAFYTRITLFRGMELIETVDSTLIRAMLAMCKDKEMETPVDLVHLKVWNDFSVFVGDSDCLGSKLRKTGYFNLTVEQMLALSGLDLREHIDLVAKSSLPAAAIDLLSLLLVCKDSYVDPMKYLENNAAVLLNGVELLSKLTAVMTSMLTDFNNHLTAAKQRV